MVAQWSWHGHTVHRIFGHDKLLFSECCDNLLQPLLDQVFACFVREGNNACSNRLRAAQPALIKRECIVMVQEVKCKYAGV